MNFAIRFSFVAQRYFLITLLALSFVFSPVLAQQKTNPPQVAAKPAVAAPIKQNTEVAFVNKVLPNGMEIIVLPDAAVPLVTVELAVRNGSFTEPPELNGLSHLYEHMFFKPNQVVDRIRQGRAQPEDLYLREINNLGITYNGSTREEVVNYYFTTTSPYWQI
jgi:zinc protease